MKYIKLSGWLCLICAITSCKKFVEVSPPKNQLVNDQVFIDSANATAAVLGIYINMMPNFTAQITNGGLSIYPGLSADEIYPTSNNGDENEFYANTISVANYTNGGLWRTAFGVVYNTNACIEGLEDNQALSSSMRNELLAEAKFARAFLYFNLINLYGAIPLVTTTDYNLNENSPRVPIDSIYAFIVSDLQSIRQYLSENYVTPDKFRPNLHAANALLSKIYLYQQNWPQSEAIASQIINSGMYNLEADLTNVFLTTSMESIWNLEVLYPTFETWIGYFFLPWSPGSIPSYVITDSLLSSFEQGDQRKDNWIASNMVDSQYYFYPNKYKIKYSGPSRAESFTVFRLAEQYLIRAEARAQQGNLAGAIDDLNVIRTRSGLPNLSFGLTSSEVFASVERERRSELFTEWGNRWFDLKRTGRADAILSSIKGTNWQSSDVLYPIPQAEIDLNSNLVQNAGY